MCVHNKIYLCGSQIILHKLVICPSSLETILSWELRSTVLRHVLLKQAKCEKYLELFTDSILNFLRIISQFQ